MSSRSRFIVGAAAAGVGIQAARSARHRAHLRAVADGIEESILPTQRPPTTEKERVADESHAPGHLHLDLTEQADAVEVPDWGLRRPWTKRYRGMQHPVRS